LAERDATHIITLSLPRSSAAESAGGYAVDTPAVVVETPVVANEPPIPVAGAPTP